ncbi:hypothetical protein ACFL1G_03830 [Planctomycetota bacterium]
MAKKPDKSHKSQTKLQDLVVVTYVKKMEEAKEYETLLKNDDIPAAIKQQTGTIGEDGKNLAVMVPEEFLDEALVVIESQDAYDDFYDFALENDIEDDFDNNFFSEDI